MKKKVLFSATVDYHFKAFHLPYLKWFKEQGWEVHVVASGNIHLPFVDKKYNIPIQRSPFNKKNISAYKQLKMIIEENEYQIIHCHTPMGGVLTRLAARKVRERETTVIYTAHGFHFCKGSPLTNWLIYYPIERILAKYTDCLITINTEDYERAKRHRFKFNNIEHVHGVGVNTEKFSPVSAFQKSVLRKVYGYKQEDFLLFYAAELSKNKNQQLLIHALTYLKDEVPNVKLLLAGDGPLQKEYQVLANKLGVSDMVDFLGLRSDIESLLKMSDIAVASSLREGLPVNVMEAMACGLSIIATKNRGHRELVRSDINGWLVNPDDSLGFANKIKTLANDESLIKQFGYNSRKIVVEKYGTDKIMHQKSEIYSMYMDQKEEVSWAAQ